jgi:hypothetical protein
MRQTPGVAPAEPPISRSGQRAARKLGTSAAIESPPPPPNPHRHRHRHRHRYRDATTFALPDRDRATIGPGLLVHCVAPVARKQQRAPAPTQLADDPYARAELEMCRQRLTSGCPTYLSRRSTWWVAAIAMQTWEWSSATPPCLAKSNQLASKLAGAIDRRSSAGATCDPRTPIVDSAESVGP